MLKIDPVSMRDAMKQISEAVGKSIEKEANYLLFVDNFAGMGEGAGFNSRYIINYTGALGKSSSITMNNEGADITWTAPYASDIEFGVLPGERNPTKEVIEKWLTTKKSTNLPITEEEARQAAPIIRDKIIRKGWSPRPFVRTAIYTVGSENYILTEV